MKVLCFGSLNIDFTYRVPHFVAKGETLAADSLQIFSGGKGLNQAIALARAGAPTFLAGAIGEDGRFLLDQLAQAGVDTSHVRILAHERTGNAIIQNDREGDNCILLYGGANRAITQAQVDQVLAHFGPGDLLVLQNEISCIPALIERAHARGMQIAFNPSPMEDSVLLYPLDAVDCLLVNQVEAAQLTGCSQTDPDTLADRLRARFAGACIVLTLGTAGAMYLSPTERCFQPACPVQAVDTTGAGDTFTGFFLAARLRGLPAAQALRIAAHAAGIAVTRPGAAGSIPTWDETAADMPPENG